MPDDFDYVPENPNTPAVASKQELKIDAGALAERSNGFAAARITDPLPPKVYEQLGQYIMTPEQEAILDAPTPDDEIDILPDKGLIYCSHEYVRRKLNAAFGRMGWSFVPGSPLAKEPGTNRYYRVWILFIGGVYAAEAMAAREYFTDNRQQDLSDVAESIKSDCIRRCGKDLGIASECWQKSFQERWRREYAIEVVVQDPKRGNVKRWRRKDRERLSGELTSNFKGTPQTGEQSGTRADERGSQPMDHADTAGAQNPSKSTTSSPGISRQERTLSSSGPANVGGQGNSPNVRSSVGDATSSKPPLRNETNLSDTASQGHTGAAAGVNPAQRPITNTAKATGPRVSQAQKNMIMARARNAGLVVAKDPTLLMDLLERRGIDVIDTPGKTAEENCMAMISQILMKDVNALLKEITAQQGDQGAERI